MAHWADVSVTTQMTIVSLDEEPSDFDPIQVEANCPMCRRPTTASLNTQLAEQLSARYPLTYSERRADEQASEADGSESAIETLTLYIGNKHRLIRPAEDSSNRHEWTFFVRPSRTDIIKEVQILIVGILATVAFLSIAVGLVTGLLILVRCLTFDLDPTPVFLPSELSLLSSQSIKHSIYLNQNELP